MAYCPFSLFVNPEDLTPGEQADLTNRPPSVLDPLGLTFYADLYRALGPVMSPAEADECELWQIGALLGVDRKESDSSNSLPLIDRLPEPGEKIDMTARMMADLGIQTQ